MDTITIRGEHLINVYRYAHEPSYRLMFGAAQGYTDEFAQRHDQIIQRLLDHPDQPVKVVMGCDDICLKTDCPNYHAEKCQAPELLAKDRRIAEIFGVELDVAYSAQDLLQQLDKMPENEAPH